MTGAAVALLSAHAVGVRQRNNVWHTEESLWLDVTLKKFYREGPGVRLQPANPTMQPILVPAEQVQIQGVVVGVMRKY